MDSTSKTLGEKVEQIFYGRMPFLTPTLPTLEPLRDFISMCALACSTEYIRINNLVHVIVM